jgi:hypothetical protein
MVIETDWTALGAGRSQNREVKNVDVRCVLLAD